MKSVLAALLSISASGAIAEGNFLNFDLGAEVSSGPAYFGSDIQETTLGFSGTVNELKIGRLHIGGGEDAGLELRTGFRVIAERNAGDYTALAGLADVEAAYEIGGGLQYTDAADGQSKVWGSQSFVEVRYGVIGHESFVAQAGADLIYMPSPQWELRAGPRLFGGDDTYADTYFSDSRVGYEALGGVLSRGFEMSASYDFNEVWGVYASATYEQFMNDAAASPIVQAGSEDQVSMSLNVTRTFRIDF